VAEQLASSFAVVLRQLRTAAGLTQEELAETARISVRSVSDLERGVNRTARKDTALLLADALQLAGPVRDRFIAAARGRLSSAEVLSAMSAPRNNLPAPVDLFVGRQAELAEIKAALRAHRLVTLTGPGGCGKTRLALEAASAVVPTFADGVWLVPLASVSDGSRLFEAVAQVLRLADMAGEAIADTVEQWLRDQELLLILDNCEHIVAAVAGLCERLLRNCGRLRVLATSREFLDVRGEHAIRTPPLTLPDDLALAPLSDAVQLFLARAEAAAPSLRPGLEDLGTVSRVCRRLDGLPLAIELVAARLRALSLTQLAARLDDQFWQVTRGGRTEHAQPRTLEAVVAWSYNLLGEDEQRVFERIAVFPGHFTLEMAEAVVPGAPVSELDVVDLVASLVGKSLVTTVNAADGLRYQLLEMLRQYGRDRLAERGEADKFQERLLAWAMSGVEHLEAAVRTPAMDDALRRTVIDAVTYRAAMQWAATNGQQGAALRIASMVPFSHHRGNRQAEILDALDRAQRAGQLDDLAAGHAWAAVANIAFELTDWDTSLRACDLAAGHFQAAGVPRLAAWTQYIRLHSAWGAGQLDVVDNLVSGAIANFRSERDEMGLGYSLWVASLRSTDLAASKDLADEADELLRRAGAPIGIAHNSEGRGIIAFERGELGAAASFIAEAVECFESYGNLGCAAHAIEAAAVVIAAADTRQVELAAELLAVATELRRQSGQGYAPWEIRGRLGKLEDWIGVPGSTGTVEGSPAPARYTLSEASALAATALRSLAATTTG
jgi:predicted ATPase/DNA-binding XRE family transcriptional regulator